MNVWVVFYPRFSFISISWRRDVLQPTIAGKKTDFWKGYFSREAKSAFGKDSAELKEFINRTYISRVKDFDLV
jgi:hypothetical protein